VAPPQGVVVHFPGGDAMVGQQHNVSLAFLVDTSEYAIVRV
jgi:hypothetical protein